MEQHGSNISHYDRARRYEAAHARGLQSARGLREGGEPREASNAAPQEEQIERSGAWKVATAHDPKPLPASAPQQTLR